MTDHLPTLVNTDRMKTSSLPQPPPGYVHDGRLFADEKGSYWRFLLRANLLALLPLSLGLVGLWLPYQLYLAWGAPWALRPFPVLTLWQTVGLGGLIFIGSMLLHEWLHGVAMQLQGVKPRYNFRHGMLFAGLRPAQHLTRRGYLIMSLTPLLTMSLMGGSLLFFLPIPVGRLWLIALLLNTAASVGDLWVATAVWQHPPTARFNDQHGIQVYLPDPALKN